MKKYISSKPIVKIIVITLFSLILSLIGLSSSSAFEERNLKKTLKIIEYCQKTNPQKLNVYKNLRKSELINEIDRFVKQIKADEQKVKFDFLNNASSIEKCDSFKFHRDTITNTINKSFKITDSQVENLICGECFDPELPNDCETIKFVQKLVEASSENTPYVWADAEIYQYFIKSQDAIRSNDYNIMCSNFNNIHPLIDKYIKNIPNCSTCPDGNCEWCETIQDELTGEFNFLKLYIEIQKGYFFVQNKTYAKAELYFNQLLNELSSQLPENPTLKSCRNNTYIENMSPLTKQKLMKSCYFFVGYIQMLQKRYTEANNSFLKFLNFGNDRNLKSYTELLPFPRSGLYLDFDCQEVVSRENINFPTTIIKMHAYTFYFMGICNENLGNKDAALTRYREYVKLNDPDYLNDAQNRIIKLENIPTPIEILEIKFLRPDGSEVKWGDVLEINKSYLIRVITKNSSNLTQIKVDYSSLISSPQSKSLMLNRVNEKTFEGSLFIDVNIINEQSNNNSFVTFDVVADSKNSFDDSDAFISNCITLGYNNKGCFRAHYNKNVSEFNYATPVLPTSENGLKSGGIEYLKISCNNNAMLFPFKNRANILYYSGHGSRKSGLAIDIDKTTSQIKWLPISNIINDWNKNLSVIILAGCSVLNDYNFWVNKGPKYFLGYRNKAPCDTQNNNITTQIINNYFLNRQKGIYYVHSWLQANDIKNPAGYHIGRNACAIDVIYKEYYYFTYDYINQKYVMDYKTIQ